MVHERPGRAATVEYWPMDGLREVLPRFGRVASLLALAALLACQGEPPPPPPPATISGALTVVTGSADALPAGASLAARGTPLAAASRPADPVGAFVPGDVIVGFADGVRASAVASLDVALPGRDAIRLDAVRPLALPNATLFRAAATTDREATLELVAALRVRPDVRYAEPNLILQPLLVPNDTFYPLQWHYPAISLPAAWDITTGSSDIVVAVADTGILFAGNASPLTHPDLVGRVLPGYDFISDPAVAGDGNGRDPDPYDVGDDPGGISSYHGSHVAGTIGAATDNGVGVAGVDWEAMILPVRVLGIGGGTLVDIVEGSLWAAGFAVAGVPNNPTPAHVINLSLGGIGPCSTFTQDAFDRIGAESPNAAILVVAAGNDAANAGFTTPANCGGAIVVGATDLRGHRSPYSNYGTRIDVMAPGGDVTVDRDGNGFVDGVLSTIRNDVSGNFEYFFYQGTSMATPHVAGVVSLMKSIEPGLTLTQVLATLTSTARPLTATECARPSGSDCGAGLIDAAAALALVDGGDIPTPGDGAIAYDPNPVDYGSTLVSREITLTNTGSATVDWYLEEYWPDPSNPGTILFGAVYFDSPISSGTLAPGASVTTAIGIDRSLVTAPGAYRIDLLFMVDGVEQPLTVRFRTAEPAVIPSGPTRIYAFEGGLPDDVGGFRLYPSFVASYAVSAPAGSYAVYAWVDQNANGEFDVGDFVGAHPSMIHVTAGQTLTGIDIAVGPVLSVGDVPAPLRERFDERASWPPADDAGATER